MSDGIGIDIPKLKQRCIATIDDCLGLGEVVTGKTGRHAFIDNGGSILAVAHADTVSDSKFFNVIELDTGRWILSRGLDDRLGLYTIFDYLPKLGVVCDVLITEGEESGKSTAQDFATEKDYNWMFQFDRGGMDTVLYQYECPELKELLKATDNTVATGSISDIKYMEHLGIKGINFATAYNDAHGEWASVQINAYYTVVTRFLKFYWAYKDTKLPHEKKVYSHVPWSAGNTGATKTTYYSGKKNHITRYSGPGIDDDNYKYSNHVPEGYRKCSECHFAVFEDFFSEGSEICDYCWSGYAIPQMDCHFCGRTARVTGFTNEGLCIFCVRELDLKFMAESKLRNTSTVQANHKHKKKRKHGKIRGGGLPVDFTPPDAPLHNKLLVVGNQSHI